jgi:hypothetical protein
MGMSKPDGIVQGRRNVHRIRQIDASTGPKVVCRGLLREVVLVPFSD